MFILMSKENPNEALEGGKEILKGISKGAALFTKRLAEGMVNASIAQQMEETQSKKIMAAGSETIKGVIKGAEESFREATPDMFSGANKLINAINRKIKTSDKDTDGE